jgi:HD-GYP domain-containing protein (c-di-GMP phosphodiesterase class II)
MMRNFSAKEADFDERVLKIARVIDEFESYRHSHATRIAALADALAQKFNFALHDRYSLQQAALVHDLGEFVMNRDYIKSNRPLREDERADVQRHTIIGEQEAAKRGLNRAVQLLVRWHHEWWNGTGYPDALQCEQIPLTARILRVAVSEAQAKCYLTGWAGIEFDPNVVKAFLSLEDLTELESFADEKKNQLFEEPVETVENKELFDKEIY